MWRAAATPSSATTLLFVDTVDAKSAGMIGGTCRLIREADALTKDWAGGEELLDTLLLPSSELFKHSKMDCAVAVKLDSDCNVASKCFNCSLLLMREKSIVFSNQQTEMIFMLFHTNVLFRLAPSKQTHYWALQRTAG